MVRSEHSRRGIGGRNQRDQRKLLKSASPARRASRRGIDGSRCPSRSHLATVDHPGLAGNKFGVFRYGKRNGARLALESAGALDALDRRDVLEGFRRRRRSWRRLRYRRPAVRQSPLRCHCFHRSPLRLCPDDSSCGFPPAAVASLISPGWVPIFSAAPRPGPRPR